MASPTMVVRKCPTCISLATFGEEYSTTTVCGVAVGASPSLGSPSICVACAAIQSSRSEKLMKPGPLTSGPAAQPLAERQRHVGLEVRERGRPDQRVRVAKVRAERRDDGVVHPLRENLLWIGHV